MPLHGPRARKPIAHRLLFPLFHFRRLSPTLNSLTLPARVGMCCGGRDTLLAFVLHIHVMPSAAFGNHPATAPSLTETTQILVYPVTAPVNPVEQGEAVQPPKAEVLGL